MKFVATLFVLLLGLVSSKPIEDDFLQGPSGLVNLKTGEVIQYQQGQEPAVLAASGLVFNKGQPHQFRAKRSASNLDHFLMGPSAFINLKTGEVIQYKHGQKPADIGESGIVFNEGPPHQLRVKRSVPDHFLMGPSALINLKTGQAIQYKQGQEPAAVAEAGIVFNKGQPHHIRAKRSAVLPDHFLEGPAGFINLQTGQAFQYKDGQKPVLVSDTGIIFNEGAPHQIRPKRSADLPDHFLQGPSGFVNLKTGQVFQYKAGQEPVVVADSGIVFNNGNNYQSA